MKMQLSILMTLIGLTYSNTLKLNDNTELDLDSVKCEIIKEANDSLKICAFNVINEKLKKLDGKMITKISCPDMFLTIQTQHLFYRHGKLVKKTPITPVEYDSQLEIITNQFCNK